MSKLIAFVTVACCAGVALAADEKPNLSVVHRIKAEAAEGKVMDHLFWLTDANGPRLTNSPGYRKAAEWAVKNLQSWGAANAHLEKWGTFGRGWTLDRFSMNMVKPVYTPLHGAPKAWSGSTNGKVSAEIVFAPLFKKNETSERSSIPKLTAAIKKYMDEHKGALRGKIVLLSDEREFEPRKEPDDRAARRSQAAADGSGARARTAQAHRVAAHGSAERSEGAARAHVVAANRGHLGLLRAPRAGHRRALRLLRQGRRGRRAEQRDARRRRHRLRRERRRLAARRRPFPFRRSCSRPSSTTAWCGWRRRRCRRSSSSTWRRATPTTRPTATTSSAKSPVTRSATRWSCSARTSTRGTPAPAPPTTAPARRWCSKRSAS